MSLCPYTWLTKTLIGSKKSNNEIAEFLRVRVVKKGEEVVSVALPAQSARWLIDLIPDDVIAKIRAEKIPLDRICAELSRTEKLVPQNIFWLEEPERQVEIWLE